MPRVAALLDAPQVSDVMSIESATRFRRPIYAGNAITTVEVAAGTKIVATIRTASFEAAAGGGSAKVEPLTPAAALPAHTRFVSLAAAGGDRPDLQSATQGDLRRPRARRAPMPSRSSTPGRQDRRRRRRLARRRGCGLRAERHAGGPDRQDHRARAVHRHRHFRRDPASHRHQGCAHHRRDQQGCARRRSSRSPTLESSATSSPSFRSWKS